MTMWMIIDIGYKLKNASLPKILVVEQEELLSVDDGSMFNTIKRLSGCAAEDFYYRSVEI